MRGVVRPAIAVLLLVGVGMAAADRAPARRCGPACALIDAADDDVRVTHTAAVLPEPVVVARVVAFPRDVSPHLTALLAPSPDPLIAAPKTSPPA